MKKTLLVSLILLSGILLTACGNNNTVNITVNWKDTNNWWEPDYINYLLDWDLNNYTNCQKAIKKYLDGADKKWKWEEIKSWDNIVVDYIWRLVDGTVFDTSIKSIARECEVYNENRNYNEWLSFQAWAGQMVKWFDNWVIWMKVWQTKTVKFWFEEWYWAYDETLLATYSLDEVWDLSQFKKWDTVYFDMWYSAKILDINDKEVTFDFNHELAGRDLIFDITVKSIN